MPDLVARAAICKQHHKGSHKRLRTFTRWPFWLATLVVMTSLLQALGYTMLKIVPLLSMM